MRCIAHLFYLEFIILCAVETLSRGQCNAALDRCKRGRWEPDHPLGQDSVPEQVPGHCNTPPTGTGPLLVYPLIA